MNNFIPDIEELKKMILSSDEYKNYKKYLEIIEDNNEIKKKVNEIVKKQKEVVRLEKSNNDIDKKEKELTKLYDELDSYDDYKKYISYSKELNVLISTIQEKFQEYFDSLVC